MEHGALQKESELAWLLHRYTTVVSGLGVLEIGSAGSGTLWAWTTLSPSSPVVSIDLPYKEYPELGPHLSLYDRFDWWHFPPGVRWIGEDSHSTAAKRLLDSIHPELFDLVFIDGDHSYAGAKLDFEDYRDRVRPGGLLAMHDIAPHSTDKLCFVHDFWRDEVVPNYETEEFIESPADWGGIGIVAL